MHRTMKLLTLFAVFPLITSTLATGTLPHLDPGIVDGTRMPVQAFFQPDSVALRSPVFTRLGAPPGWEVQTSSERYAGPYQPYLTR